MGMDMLSTSSAVIARESGRPSIPELRAVTEALRLTGSPAFAGDDDGEKIDAVH